MKTCFQQQLSMNIGFPPFLVTCRSVPGQDTESLQQQIQNFPNGINEVLIVIIIIITYY